VICETGLQLTDFEIYELYSNHPILWKRFTCTLKKEMLLSKVDHKKLWNIEEERKAEGKGD
jgi:hypothetical protein